MQKADLSNLGDLYLIDLETGEKVPWDGVVEIEDDESDNEIFSSTTAILHVSDGVETVIIPQEVEDKLNVAAVAMCSTGQKIHESILAMIREQEKFAESFKEGLMNALEDDKTPNPIYIPKHIQHRKKGRR